MTTARVAVQIEAMTKTRKLTPQTAAARYAAAFCRVNVDALIFVSGAMILDSPHAVNTNMATKKIAATVGEKPHVRRRVNIRRMLRWDMVRCYTTLSSVLGKALPQQLRAVQAVV
jgi:hypothetical protein